MSKGTGRGAATVLVVGASGATGRLLVAELLGRGHRVKVVVRAPDRLPETLRDNPLLDVIHAELLELRDEEMARHVKGCTAIASCLGHNMNLGGIYGAPRQLVTDATRRLCEAVRANRPRHPVRFVLMNTAGNRDPVRDGPRSLPERAVVALIRGLLPPHRDNEKAAGYLQDAQSGPEDRAIEWVVVRPDTLIDEAGPTEHEAHPSPTRSSIFHAGKTSRSNVAHFMADLISDDETWRRWKGQMPVLYNKGYS